MSLYSWWPKPSSNVFSNIFFDNGEWLMTLSIAFWSSWPCCTVKFGEMTYSDSDAGINANIRKSSLILMNSMVHILNRKSIDHIWPIHLALMLVIFIILHLCTHYNSSLWDDGLIKPCVIKSFKHDCDQRLTTQFNEWLSWLWLRLSWKNQIRYTSLHSVHLNVNA